MFRGDWIWKAENHDEKIYIRFKRHGSCVFWDKNGEMNNDIDICAWSYDEKLEQIKLWIPDYLEGDFLNNDEEIR